MDEIAEVFDLVAQLAVQQGHCNVTDLVTIRVDDKWTVKVNGHRTETKEHIPPFHAAIEYNGFPAGLITPFGGSMVDHPNANESLLCEALRAALEAYPDT